MKESEKHKISHTMEENKEMEKSNDLDVQLNSGKVDEPGKSGSTGILSPGHEINSNPLTDEECKRPVVSGASVSESGIGSDESEADHKDKMGVNISPEDRTKAQLDDNSELCTENSAAPEEIPCDKLLSGSRDTSSNGDEISDSTCTSYEQRDREADPINGSMCDPAIESESASEPGQVISQDFNDSNVNNELIEKDENSSTVNIESQMTSPETSSEVLTGCAADEESVYIRDITVDSDNSESCGIVDSVSNVEIQKKSEESDSEGINADNNELEMISCESSCDQDIKQMENINIDEKDVFPDAANEQTYERDPLLQSPEVDRDEENIDEVNKCDITDICETENCMSSLKESGLKRNDGSSRSENDESEGNINGNLIRDTEFDNEDQLEHEDIIEDSKTSKIRSKNSAMNVEKTVLHSDNAVIGSDSIITESGDVGVDSRDAILVNEDVILDNEDEILDNEDAVLDNEDVVLNSEDAVLGAEDTVMDTEEAVLGAEDAVMDTEDAVMSTEDAVMDTEDAVLSTEDAVMDTEDTLLDTEDAVLDTEDAVLDTNDAEVSNTIVDKEDSVFVEDAVTDSEVTVIDSENTANDKEGIVIQRSKSTTETEIAGDEGQLESEEELFSRNVLHVEDAVSQETKKDIEVDPSCQADAVDIYVQDSKDLESDAEQLKPTKEFCVVEDSATSIKSNIVEKSMIDNSQDSISSDSTRTVILPDQNKSSEEKEDKGSKNSDDKRSVSIEEEVMIDENLKSVENDSLKNIQINDKEILKGNDNDSVSVDKDKVLDAVSSETKETENTASNAKDKVDEMEVIEGDSSQRDKMSPMSVDICQKDSDSDKVPTTSNQEILSDHQEVASESNDEMEVEELDIEEDTGRSDIDNCEGIDISAMCETVIEEPGSLDELENTPMSQFPEDKVTNRILHSAKGDNKRQAGRSLGVEDEEICIIPDTFPRSMKKDVAKRKMDQRTQGRSVDQSSPDCNDGKKDERGKVEANKVRKAVKPTEIEKLCDKTALEKISMESRRTPGRPQRQAAKRAESQIKEIAAEEVETEERNIGSCDNCYKVRTIVTSITFQENGVEKIRYFCTPDCAANYKKMSKVRPGGDIINNNTSVGDSGRRFTRKCAQCSSFILGDEHTLSWETMDYCNEDCLGKYQKIFGSQCANCRGTVAGTSLGKYCVRFGYDVKQFCCSGCLEEFKKGLKLCSYCLKDISGGSEGFLAPVGDKGQFKDFCTQSCMEKYDQMSNHNAPPVVVQECAVCNHEKVVAVEVVHKELVNKFCSEPCFAAFRFVNGMIADQCFMCKKYFDKNEVENFSVFSDELVHNFCSKTCMNVYILANRKIVPCHWCKVKKYNFDMIKKVINSGLLLVCSLNCLSLYEAASNNSRKRKCDMCSALKPLQYQLHMLDNTSRSFCNYQCAVQFQEKYSNSVGVVPSPLPPDNSLSKSNGTAAFPVISSVQSLAGDNAAQNSVSARKVPSIQPNSSHTKIMRQIIVRPPAPRQMRNKAISCKPLSHTKGTHCRPMPCTKETQTEKEAGKPILIPVPVPIYVPAPMCMYSHSFPVPVPFPLPVPVPIFIPTTRNSAKGIMKEIKRIQEKTPADPFEAELLMMAEIVAGEKKKDQNSDSDSDAADNPSTGTGGAGLEESSNAGAAAGEGYTPETVDANNTFGDDMLQMALKMATELEEPTDLEAALTPSTITTQPQKAPERNNSESEDDPEPVQPVPELRPTRGRKRSVRTSNRSTPTPSPSNKRRRVSNLSESSLPPPEPQPQPVEKEKPDANMCLKYTLGVNAWKRWVLTKNEELGKATASNRKLKLFKTEILQQTADELNYSLCLFVKEVRKPSGQEYAPDTIYYLCLGIQQYLFENGRIDNIFTDPFYEKFTECLDEVAKKFATLYNDSQYIVTRVEEEHLWESKQLGAHSPHVLLSTLMFFNTKHFNLVTVEEHMELSFSHIMKHWKRNPNQTGSSKGPGGSRNVLLRFYPPPSALENNSRKKKVYEQQENEENPLRCPVKLYEFYLSKCPESVKTRNDVFYLQPERSCVPDSPVWYSTMALGKEPLMKMLHRVKMVKEINQALLKS